MTSAAKSPYAGYRFPGEIISHAVWLYFRFPLSLRMVDEMLAARGIEVSHETVRQWGRKFGQGFANQIRRRLPCVGDKWHLDGNYSPPHRDAFLLLNQQLTPISGRCRVESNCRRDVSRAASCDATLVVSSGMLLV